MHEKSWQSIWGCRESELQVSSPWTLSSNNKGGGGGDKQNIPEIPRDLLKLRIAMLCLLSFPLFLPFLPP